MDISNNYQNKLLFCNKNCNEIRHDGVEMYYFTLVFILFTLDSSLIK